MLFMEQWKGDSSVTEPPEAPRQMFMWGPYFFQKSWRAGEGEEKEVSKFHNFINFCFWGPPAAIFRPL
jgi:hypothetical protein